MREKLNSNPTLQIALIGILAIAVAYFFLLGGGGGGESKGTAATAETPATAETSSTTAAATPAAATPEGEAVAAEAGTAAPTAGIPAEASTMPTPSLPAPILRAYRSSKTVVLLVVRGGGIDDRFVARSVRVLALLPKLDVFVTRAKDIARYSAITLGVDVERVPALIVVRPRRLSHGTLQATVSYGYQSPQSVVQAARDASYKGPEPTYYPN